jgi:hypothetical protein
MTGARPDGRPRENGMEPKRMKGLEPSTFCMARTKRERTATAPSRQNGVVMRLRLPERDPA